MASLRRPSTTSTSATISYPFCSFENDTTTLSRPKTSRTSRKRPLTRGTRPTTAASTIARIENQHVVCAVSESRGISPTVGLAFVNLDTGEAVLCQICDSQTYVRTIHKLHVYAPTEILIVQTASNPKSKLFSIIEESLEELGSEITLADRKLWSESAGMEHIQHFAFAEDIEAIKLALEGNYFAVCCFAAVLKYIELGLSRTFPFHSLRIKYEPSEGSMMIDISTIRALELIQNLESPKSRDCLYGLLNSTQTPMGARLLRSNVLQPLTDMETLNTRYDALEELSTKEEMFFATRQALKAFLDVDKILTELIIVPTKTSAQSMEQAINQVLMLKQFVSCIEPVYSALTGARSTMLSGIRELCNPDHVAPVQNLINEVINEDTIFAWKPIDLRNQHTYAVKSGTNGLLDVARQAYREASDDVYQHVKDLAETHELALDIKFDSARQFYIQFDMADIDNRVLPATFTNIYKKKNKVECQTLEMMKRNQKVVDAHYEVVLLSHKTVQGLIERVRGHMATLFKVCESIGMLDMMTGFANLVTSQDYVRPILAETLAIKAGRHPIREKIQSTKFIPNDFYATQQKRFQIITGCNMSGKSTYIRSVALMAVMAQIGMFVPAQYGSFPILHQLFARVSLDDSIEANMSTFAAEMRETAFILRNVDKRSMAIIDELGRGTSTRDGLAIALAIAEALVSSRALVWFATHFRDLANIMAERNGVVNLHLSVDMRSGNAMHMLYKVAEGPVQERNYGLALARVVPLPPDMIQTATDVATRLVQNLDRKKRTSTAVVRERRRKLILNLKEHLMQARAGNMEGQTLKGWLKELQREFIVRMAAIDAEAQEAEEEEARPQWYQTEGFGETSENLMDDDGQRGGDFNPARTPFAERAGREAVNRHRVPRPDTAITISSALTSSTIGPTDESLSRN
ncbi:muts domain V-domain-containing protein [Phyllosticta citribraziliensis]|uniref:Muts domain V-domain-containing protein n=1 Tax=Phyllosticta citribraziliensis TaxID=989973 RepID=A0ABR1M723_9PEZI